MAHPQLFFRYDNVDSSEHRLRHFKFLLRTPDFFKREQYPKLAPIRFVKNVYYEQEVSESKMLTDLKHCWCSVSRVYCCQGEGKLLQIKLFRNMTYQIISYGDTSEWNGLLKNLKIKTVSLDFSHITKDQTQTI